MEIWDLYDINRIKTGDTVQRGDRLPDDRYHIVVHVCIFNSKGEMLIQQRQPFKQGWSNMWDVTVGGSATTGDTSQIAAQRECLEEIGYEIDLTNVRPHFTINFQHEENNRGGFDDWYIVHADVDIDSLQLSHEEVKCVKWATKEEIMEMHDRGEFVPHYKSMIEMIFDMRGYYGGIPRERL